MGKVYFGLSELYVGTYTVSSGGVVTLGTPYHQPGAVAFSPEPQGDTNNFYADNIAYFTSYGGGSREGDLEVAAFDKKFKTDFLGYVTLADDGLAEIKNATKPAVYIMFQIESDEDPRRVIMYNGTFGDITREYSTIEESPEPVTESVPATFVGDNATGITVVTYEKNDTGYATLFTNPPVPTLP